MILCLSAQPCNLPNYVPIHRARHPRPVRCRPRPLPADDGRSGRGGGGGGRAGHDGAVPIATGRRCGGEPQAEVDEGGTDAGGGEGIE